MTEEEWLTCNDPAPMLDFLADKVDSERKDRLFGVACCRRIWPLLRDERSRKAVEVAERYADGQATENELSDAARAASDAARLGRYGGDDSWTRDSFAAGMEGTAMAAAWAATWGYAGSIELSDAAATAAVPTWEQRPSEFLAQAILLRCIFGARAFRQVSVDASVLSWQGANIPKLAQSIFDDRAFHLLPELADALEAAGCADAEVLDHCRGPGPHVRGCWVVDAVLGKS
jgi:hypothetical protein